MPDRIINFAKDAWLDGADVVQKHPHVTLGVFLCVIAVFAPLWATGVALGALALNKWVGK
jgi:hypothetical protein